MGKICLNSNLIYGVDSCAQLPNYISENLLEYKLILVVDRNVLNNSKYVKSIVQELVNKKFDLQIFEYSYNGEPTYEYLDKVADELSISNMFNLAIIAIGGGSAIDFAKGLAILNSNEGPSVIYRGFPTSLNKPAKLIAIPTTAGTGTEVTYNAVFTQASESRKLGINYHLNYPILSILDPKCVINAPRNVIAHSGMDALVHALEGFSSLKSDLFSRNFSRQAFHLLKDNLLDFYNDPSDIYSAENVQLGASLAMFGLQNSGGGITGSLSYFLGAQYGVPHGLAGGVILPFVVEIIHNKNLKIWSELYEYSEAEASQAIESSLKTVHTINAIARSVQVLPSALKSYGCYGQDFIQKYKAYCEKDLIGALELMPVSVSEDELMTIGFKLGSMEN
jgi:alcohol dehydrogenase class IV